MKVVKLKVPAAEKKNERAGGFNIDGDDQGVFVHLAHHHLKRMGVDGQLTPGQKVKFKGHGHVHSAEKDGPARLMLTHAGMEHSEPDADDKPNEREGRRSDIEAAYEKGKR